jgi:hypothetical protein
MATPPHVPRGSDDLEDDNIRDGTRASETAVPPGFARRNPVEPVRIDVVALTS